MKLGPAGAERARGEKEDTLTIHQDAALNELAGSTGARSLRQPTAAAVCQKSTCELLKKLLLDATNLPVRRLAS